jgi:8-oxo-dGTP pyrophosphatase MutT (NUDIX family)
MKPSRVTVGVVLVNGAGQVLMQLRDDKPSIADPGCWAIPGGGQDPGESPEEAARRELLEETGYRLGDLSFVLTRNLDRGDGFIERQFYYYSEYDGIQPLQCFEGQALKFIDLECLRRLKLTPGLGPIVEQALQMFVGLARTVSTNC